MIRVVSFDGDDTLWHFETVLYAALERCLDELRVAVPGGRARDHTVEHLMAARAAAEQRGAGTRDLRELRRLGFEVVLEELGHPDPALAERLTDVFLEHRSALIEPYPEVLPALDALGRRYTLGLISNGNADTERCVLAGRFAFRVHAHQHGVEKPDPALFRIALREAGCDPGEMLHVGDSLEFDVVGAQAAGVRAVWLNRTRATAPGDVRPDAEIRGLDELQPVLDRLA